MWNRVNKNTKYIILLWHTEKDLIKVKKIKQKKPYIKVIAVPTACRYVPEKFIKSDFTDYLLTASDWHKKATDKTVDKKYWHKIVAWPSGVQVDKKKPNKAIHNTVLCYYKLVKENPEITEYLKNHGITVHVLEYGKYQQEDYVNLLSSVDFVIFTQDILKAKVLPLRKHGQKTSQP